MHQELNEKDNEIEHLQQRNAPYRIPIDTVLYVVDKNDSHEHGRGRRHNHYTIRCLRVRYPDLIVREPERNEFRFRNGSYYERFVHPTDGKSMGNILKT